MADYREAFVGIDVAKRRNAIAIAEAGREGEVRFFGEVDASATNMGRLIARIANRFDRVHFCYEAGPTGLWPLSPDPIARPPMHGGGAIADPKEAGAIG